MAINAKKKGNKGKKRPLRSLSSLKKKLDALFSTYIRTKYSKNGICTCYTCGKKLPIKSIQNGHFVPRQYLATRWEEKNCRPQCWGCNGYGKGQILVFEEHLIKDIGKTAVQKLKTSRHKVLKLDRQWYEEQIAKYKV